MKNSNKGTYFLLFFQVQLWCFKFTYTKYLFYFIIGGYIAICILYHMLSWLEQTAHNRPEFFFIATQMSGFFMYSFMD